MKHRRHRPTSPGWRLVAVSGLLAVLMVGCMPASADPSPSASAPSPTGSRDAAREEQRALAHRQMLLPSEMPAPWTAAGPADADDFRETLCGVDTEPVAPLVTSSSAWTRPDGAELLQTARPIGDERAASIVAALGRAVPECGRDERTTPDGTITYEITPLPLRHGDAVAFRQVPSKGFPTARVYVARGGVLIVFRVVGEYPDQEAALFDQLVQAVLDKA